jgi:hypothetical protein
MRTIGGWFEISGLIGQANPFRATNLSRKGEKRIDLGGENLYTRERSP